MKIHRQGMTIQEWDEMIDSGAKSEDCAERLRRDGLSHELFVHLVTDYDWDPKIQKEVVFARGPKFVRNITVESYNAKNRLFTITARESWWRRGIRSIFSFFSSRHGSHLQI
jgi:hypothetical protein